MVVQFASGLAAQSSASRLLYAMGHDSVLPKPVFSKLSEEFHVSWLVLGVVVLVLTRRAFKAAQPEMTATEKATIEAAT